MWPEHRGDALSRQIPVETAVQELYAAGLDAWAPGIERMAMPALAAAALPPDPSAVDNADAQQGWSTQTKLIVAGVAVLWAAMAYEALSAIGLPLPPLPPLPKGRRNHSYVLDSIDVQAVKIVQRATKLTRREIGEAVAAIDNNSMLSVIRDQVVTNETTRAAKVPATVAQKVEAASTKTALASSKEQLTVEQTAVEQRRAVSDVLDPVGPTMAQIAESAGHDSGAVQNNAIVRAAQFGQDEDDPLDKVWISTIDGHTRPTHWAADGQRVPLSASFTVGAEQLDYPQDPKGSPGETKNCRCRVGILARDEKLPDEVDRHTERLDGRDATAVHREGSQADEIARREVAGNVRARDDQEGIGRVASGAPSEQEYSMADDTTEAETFRTFTAVLAFFGEPTSDSRMLAKKMDLSMRTFPHPLMWCKQTGYGHEDAFTVGVIENAERKGNKLVGTGYLLNTEEADEAANELGHKVTSPSVDLADTEWTATDRDEKPITYADYEAAYEAGDPIKVYTTMTKGELIGSTLVATAAFGDTSLTLTGKRETRDVALVAAAEAAFKPRTYPAAFLADPKLTEPTPVTVTEDGHVFGHFACTGTCHRSIQGDCVTPPYNDDFANFLTSPPVLLDDGTTQAVGRLTVGGKHASTARNISSRDAAAHYDNVATCWALVNVGKDEHGWWFSGVLAPWATPEQIEMGLAAPLSGDWRNYGAGLKLTAIHSVNTPGFMIASGATDNQGRPLALVASLAPQADDVQTRSNVAAAGIDIDALAAAIVKRQALESTAAQLAARAAARPELPPEPEPVDQLATLIERTKARA